MTTKKPAPKTVAERQADLRKRRAALSLAEVRGVFANLEDHPPIKEAAAKIIRKRAKRSPT